MNPPPHLDHDARPPPAAERPSKTQRKKVMHELQDLGAELVQLPAQRLDGLRLPEALLEALDEYRRTRSHEGRRRQMQYIGKLMRQVDAAAIGDAVASFRLGQARDTLALHRAERWRDELVADDDALTRFGHAHPEADLQQLRSLVRAARRDAAAATTGQRHGRPWRELFQFLRDAADAAPRETRSADDRHE
jgi:ribosome-associated protein